MKNKNIYSVLIANRGEIANRIIRTCKKLGIRSVLVYSEIDKNTLPVELADEAYNIGGKTAAESYLDIEKIISVAKQAKVDAIHPGYGFLSENAAFSERCKKEGIKFIGPSANSIDAMGSKSNAKRLMQQFGVPVIPGYSGEDQSMERFKQEAKRISYPLLIKAAAGGGGKGMQIVREDKELEKAIETAKREGKSYFGSDELIIEKYFDKVRHIEVQIMGDSHGNVLHFFERECSIQRRYQKIIEESPSPAVSQKIRDKITQAAIQAAKAINYENAGTVEFILDNKNDFYFLEVNTRLQVEHPVTEEITGIDLVALQISVAEGKPIPYKQEDLSINGYAIECRIYAEDSAQEFLPQSGKVIKWDVETKNVRIETHMRDGEEVSIFYDPMIAKFITHGKDRLEAQRKMISLLTGMYAPGIKTNKEFLLNILKNEDFKEGKYSTHFLEENMSNLLPNVSDEAQLSFYIACTIFDWVKRTEKIPDSLKSWRNLSYQPHFVNYTYKDKEIKINYDYKENGLFLFYVEQGKVEVYLKDTQNEAITLEISGKIEKFKIATSENTYFVQHNNGLMLEISLLNRFPLTEGSNGASDYVSPMPAQVLKTCFKPNEQVKSGDTLIILSSMKMEISITANTDGVVEEYLVAEGDSIPKNTQLLNFKPNN
jgi:acetyl-CoA carboxylase biotin carboxylase subunit